MVTSTTGIGSIFQNGANTSDNINQQKSVFDQSADMYLSLFLTQLKNQDPTEPFDTSKMAEQLSQLNTSQQLITTNKSLQELISVNKNSQASSLAGFINKNVEYLGDTFYMKPNDTQKFSYFVDDDYKSVNLEIRDEKGVLIRKIAGDKTQGSHDMTWDGKDATGTVVKEGTYKVTAVSEGTDGKFGGLSTFLTGTVTGIDFASSANPTVFIGADKYRIGVDISRISAISGGTTTTNTSNT